MNWTTYTSKFTSILEGTYTEKPYDNPEYVEYVKLNNSRLNRWDKKLVIPEEALATIESINEPQTWILIVEHWCGDAANLAPVINKIAESNDNITLDIQLRDSEPFLIEQYLTNGGKSVPKLIVRDSKGNDLFTWGPRPAECQAMVMSNKDADMTAQEKKAAIQVWYNKDKGQSTFNELAALIAETIPVVA
ncbi:MAG TPA: thioredoxin family protein [Crocinitomicaceae bacterium]|nr:thioredoxin family protein [Crocinitomicaceae bacterium]